MNRPFSLADAIVLVGATAVGFAMTRDTAAIWRVSQRVVLEFGYRPIRSSEIEGYAISLSPTPFRMPPSLRIQNAVFRATPCLAAWSLAAWTSQFRRPRPKWSLLARRPGAAASSAVVLALVANALLWPQVWQPSPSPTFTVPPGRYWDPWAWSMMTWASLPRTAGMAVALAWSLLWQGGLWEPDPGWLDRLGRTLGTCWIGLGVASITAPWLSAFSY